MCYNPITRLKRDKSKGLGLALPDKTWIWPGLQHRFFVYRKLPRAQEHPWCVDPALLAREVLGLTVRYRHLSEDGELLGLTSYGETGGLPVG